MRVRNSIQIEGGGFANLRRKKKKGVGYCCTKRSHFNSAAECLTSFLFVFWSLQAIPPSIDHLAYPPMLFQPSQSFPSVDEFASPEVEVTQHCQNKSQMYPQKGVLQCHHANQCNIKIGANIPCHFPNKL